MERQKGSREMKYDPRDLVRRAFVATQSKRGPEWRRMNMGELKSRLLDLSNREFSESKHGAATFKAFVEQISDLVVLDQSTTPPTVELIVESIEASTDPQLVEAAVIDKEVIANDMDKYRAEGNRFAVGELLAQGITGAPDHDFDRLLANIAVNWASSSAVAAEVQSTRELIERIDQFVPSQLALAVVHTVARCKSANREVSPAFSDLAYRLNKPLEEIVGVVRKGRLGDVVRGAMAKMEETLAALRDAVKGFQRTTTVTAKQPSIEVIKQGHRYAEYALPGERHLLREIDVLLGPVFRKFCESCERHEASVVPRRAGELRQHIRRFQDSYGDKTPYVLWSMVLLPIVDHVVALIEDGMRVTDEYAAPSVRIVGSTFKLDLANIGRPMTFPARLRNDGQGTAYGLRLSAICPDASAGLVLVEPAEPFDLPANGERLISLTLTTRVESKTFSATVQWIGATANGRTCEFKQTLEFAQQTSQPNWEFLRNNPPYTINPIKEKKDLYGRDSIISELELHASSGTSTFLWGQKRVGKTSVLQVLTSELLSRSDVTCVFLRMGELKALHEGQIAHTIATRLVEASKLAIDVPTEEHFGAGMGKLIPFVERLCRVDPDRKFLVIIDEFDDLDPAFYTGERGKQFVKALRSLSEVGLTFFFVGSERMDAIYKSHASDLNKWVSLSLDRIQSEEDCAALITRPVSGVIEFDQFAVKSISQYCNGNPFYMHLLCSAIFRRCWQEHRTFVGESDVENIRRDLLRTLGPYNFVHFWEDNPELTLMEWRRQRAQSCLYLACLASIGGAYESVEDLLEAQLLFKLPSAERLTRSDYKLIEARLLRRGVMVNAKEPGRGIRIGLPVFREWVIANSEAYMVPEWRKYAQEQLTATSVLEDAQVYVEAGAFPIAEDELLPVSEKLVYLGKQKDVAEVRRWLRQFDDDNRIEIAFVLLKRLVERGFINEGATINALTRMQDSINARRLKVGDGSWRVIKQRLDNLCITFADSETKSGAVVARELAKRMRPGKCSSMKEVKEWILSHAHSDSMLVIADDFAGTGRTMVDGVGRLWSQDEKLLTRLAKEGRVVCCLQTAFPEAAQRIQRDFSDVVVLVMETFGDDVRALDESAGLFADDGELRFAKDVLLQFGRQLTPQNPLGFGDIGALVAFHNTTPNNTLPIFWSNGTVNDRPWHPLLPRASYR